MKGQFNSQVEVVTLVKENNELGNRVRELEKKLQIYADRIKEYDEILRSQADETERATQHEKVMRGECDGLKKKNAFLEEYRLIACFTLIDIGESKN